MKREEAVNIVRRSELHSHAEHIIQMLQPSARIIVGDVAATGSGSYLAGCPDAGPHRVAQWDRRASLERQALDFEAKSQANPKATRLRDIAAKMREDMNAGPAPLGFLGRGFVT